MLFLLSPAKNLDFAPAPDAPEATKPALTKDLGELVDVAKDLSARDLKRLMGISDNLADLNHQRFQAFKTRGKPASSKQAALAFNGDVYQGLDAATLAPRELAYAQDHVRILSGLYGVLRPLDAIQPYRLEMGTRLKNPRGADLYAFWGDRVAKELNKAAKGHDDPTVVNLASKEYFGVVDRGALKPPVLTAVFKEEKDGKLRQLQFYAKRARGLMARWAAQNRPTRLDDIKDFDLEGYAFAPNASRDDEWVFTRPQPAPKGKA